MQFFKRVLLWDTALTRLYFQAQWFLLNIIFGILKNIHKISVLHSINCSNETSMEIPNSRYKSPEIVRMKL